MTKPHSIWILDKLDTFDFVVTKRFDVLSLVRIFKDYEINFFDKSEWRKSEIVLIIAGIFEIFLTCIWLSSRKLKFNSEKWKVIELYELVELFPSKCLVLSKFFIAWTTKINAHSSIPTEKNKLEYLSIAWTIVKFLSFVKHSSSTVYLTFHILTSRRFC